MIIPTYMLLLDDKYQSNELVDVIPMSSSSQSNKPARKSLSEKMKEKKKARKAKKPKIDHELAAKCEKLIGSRIASMEYPGGDSRESVKLILKRGKPVYVSSRSRKSRADIERSVLETASKAGANVPKLLGSDGQKLLIQEEIPGVRLTQAIHKRGDKTVFRYLDNALSSLAKIQVAGSESGLDEELPRLGEEKEWLVGLLDRPSVLGHFFEIEAPEPELAKLESILAFRQPRFVKWDARPGNAIAREDEEVFWIDWEHSGTRNRMDDVVWLLADEFIPDMPEMEAKILDKYLPIFADDLSLEQARKYFFAYGVFHLTVRLGLIFKYKEDGEWWSYEKCLAKDKVGVTLKNATRICKRGERWAAVNPETQVLSQWFKDVRASLS